MTDSILITCILLGFSGKIQLGYYSLFRYNITVLRTLYKKIKSSDKNNSVRQTLNIRLFHNKNNDL